MLVAAPGAYTDVHRLSFLTVLRLSIYARQKLSHPSAALRSPEITSALEVTLLSSSTTLNYNTPIPVSIIQHASSAFLDSPLTLPQTTPRSSPNLLYHGPPRQ